MEILILVLLYYLSQNPNFAASVQPIMAQLKDSEQMLSFLKDLSSFSKLFGDGCTPTAQATAPKNESKTTCEAKDKTPPSPTKGIADEFIQNILDSYLKQK